MESRRAEWAERVAGWRRSGLTAKEFARSIGVNVGTLTHWAWRLGYEQRRRHSKRRSRQQMAVGPAPLIEVVSRVSGDEGFELQLDDGRRVRIPAGFDAAALQRLLAVLAGPR